MVDALLSEGFTVRVFDRTKPVRDEVEWLKGDLLSNDDVHDAVQDVETVFHLAAVADVSIATTDPELCLRVNELGTLNLLHACAGWEVERFVLASTVWVYGKTRGIVTEETATPPPNDIYTKTKIGQEHLVYSCGQSYSIPFTILRYDIPYGPRMRSNMAIATFVRKAMHKEPLTVYGEGKQGRCWIFASDLARAHCRVLNKATRNQIINLAGGEFVTISEIVSLLSKTFGDLPVKHEALRPGDFEGVRTSIDKARELIGWSPATRFAEGLSKYVAYVRGS